MDSEIQPWRITVYDRAFNRLGWVDAPSQLTCTLRRNAIGTANFTVPTTHRMMASLLTEGARVVLEHDVAWDVPGRPLWVHALSGPIVAAASQGPSQTASATFTVADDWRLLRRVLGWPLPSAPLDAQTVERDALAGPAETVAKDLIRRNAVDRLGMPVTIEPDGGRGADVSIGVRMAPLADALLPAVEQAGIDITVRQQDAGLYVAVREGTQHPRALTEESGALRSWSHSSSAPEASRIVVGGQGEGVARSFRQVVDGERETLYGEISEAFLDATDVTTSAQLDARGSQQLAERAATSGLSVTLADAPSLRLLRDIHVGDRLAIRIGPVEVIDVLREATISWRPDTGLRVTPAVGGWTSSPQRELVNIVSRIAREVSNLGRR